MKILLSLFFAYMITLNSWAYMQPKTVTGGGNGISLEKTYDSRGYVTLKINYFGKLVPTIEDSWNIWDMNTPLELYLKINDKESTFTISNYNSYYNAQLDKHIAFGVIELSNFIAPSGIHTELLEHIDFYQTWNIEMSIGNQEGEWDTLNDIPYNNYNFQL